MGQNGKIMKQIPDMEHEMDPPSPQKTENTEKFQNNWKKCFKKAKTENTKNFQNNWKKCFKKAKNFQNGWIWLKRPAFLAWLKWSKIPTKMAEYVPKWAK